MSSRPSPVEPPARPVWSRRRVLGTAVLGITAATAGVALAGCSGAEGAPTALATPPPDTAGHVIDRHRQIRAAYAETAAVHPSLDGLLGMLRGEVDEHITALEKAFARTSTGPTAAATGTTPAVAPDAATARTALVQAVQAAIPDLRALAGATDARRAPLVGSVAASCACHAELLS